MAIHIYVACAVAWTWNVTDLLSVCSSINTLISLNILIHYLVKVGPLVHKLCIYFIFRKMDFRIAKKFDDHALYFMA